MDDVHEPEPNTLDEVMRAHAQAPWPELGVVDGDAMWMRVRDAIAQDPSHARPTWDSRLAQHSGARRSFARMAIGVAFALVVGFVGVLRIWHPERERRASIVTQYATGHGQRARHVLPDGSQVVLAPDSRLTYAVERSGARILTLVGQGHFTVTHDVRRAFTVRTGAINTTVLGTTFDIRHYANDSTVQIVVVSGKVAAHGRGNPVLLIAGTEGQLTDSTALIVTNRNVNAAEAWTQGRMVFDDVPVSVVLQALHRWYGYDFRVTDSALARRQVTMMFSIYDTVTTMAALKTLLGVTLRFDGSTVTLDPIHTSPSSGRPTRRWPAILPSQAASHAEVGK